MAGLHAALVQARLGPTEADSAPLLGQVTRLEATLRPLVMSVDKYNLDGELERVRQVMRDTSTSDVCTAVHAVTVALRRR